MIFKHPGLVMVAPPQKYQLYSTLIGCQVQMLTLSESEKRHSSKILASVPCQYVKRQNGKLSSTILQQFINLRASKRFKMICSIVSPTEKQAVDCQQKRIYKKRYSMKLFTFIVNSLYKKNFSSRIDLINAQILAYG